MPIRVEKKPPVTTIIMDNPHIRNAVDKSTAKELVDAFKEFESDSHALVGVLWGNGGNFCAGANLKALGTDKQNIMEEHGDGPMGPTRMMLSKPVIAAVSGYAVAGGLELAIWADLRIVEKSAIFGVFCRRFGIPLIDGGTIRLPRLIGLSRALDMILTGRPIHANEAFTWGLANRVVEDGKSKQESEKLALKIAKFPQICMRNDRLSTFNQFGLNLTDALKLEFKYGLNTLESGEYLKGGQEFTQGKGRHGKFN